MKRKLFLLSVMTLYFCVFSCNSDDGDIKKEEKEQTPTFNVTSTNIVGVWLDGAGSFISFSSDNYNSTVIKSSLVDEGDYTIIGDTIYVTNSFFGRKTKYVITSITNERIWVTITYTDYKGNKQELMSVYKRSDKEPCRKDNLLVGKSHNGQYATKGKSTFWTTTSMSHNTMYCSCTTIGNYQPFTLYYVYLHPKMYFYIIGNASSLYEGVRVKEISYEENGKIWTMGPLYGEEW